MDISWSEEDGVIIVRFQSAKILDEEQIQDIGAVLMHACAAAERTGKMLVDFAAVRVMSSAMIGKLVLLNQKAKQGRIDMKFCSINPNVLEVFKITRLDKIFRVTEDPFQISERKATPFDEPFGRYLADRNLTWTAERREVVAAVHSLAITFNAADTGAVVGDLERGAVIRVLFELWDAGLLEQKTVLGVTQYRKLC